MSVPDPVYKPILGFVNAQLVINAAICLLVIVAVSLRVVGRLTGPGCGWDDWLVIAAVPLGIVMLVCQGLFAVVGNGYDLAENPELAVNVIYILVVTFSMQIFYVLLLALVKASMLCFYLRVFVTPYMQKMAKIGLGVVAAWAVAYVAACVFLCDPISGQWTGVGKCGTYMSLIQSLIITNAIGDAVIMAMPMHSIWTLQMRKTDKLGVISCFLVGLACLLCAVFRVIYLSSVALSTNVTGTMPTTVFLFVLEPNLAILCVSIPMLRPLWRRYRKRFGGSRLQGDDSAAAHTRGTGGRDLHHSSSNKRAYGTGSSGKGGGGLGGANANALALSQWELEDYESQDSSHGAAVTRGEEMERLKAGEGIGVQTTWTVTRE